MEQRATVLTSLPNETALALRYDWEFCARDKQLPPADDEWTTWLILAGRGFGKTRTGAEWVIDQARRGGKGFRIALVAATSADVRDTMVEGESGILACSPPWFTPSYQVSKRRLVWPNGAIATAYTAEKPRLLRGPQHHAAWCDELCAWQYSESFDQLQFGLRLGQRPRTVITTTPRPTKQLREIQQSSTTRTTSGTTYENLANLAPTFATKILAKYEGTRLGEQELKARVLEDTPGALWTLTGIDADRVWEVPEMKRVVVAIDPSAAEDGGGDECGIVAVGLGIDDVVYVLADRSDNLSPDAWAKAAVALSDEVEADCIVAEANNGGGMVSTTIGTAHPKARVKLVHAARGKRARAEPVSALYEQHKAHHVGTHPKLEDEMTTWAAMSGEKSPNRIDALVWAITELVFENVAPAEISRAKRFRKALPSTRV